MNKDNTYFEAMKARDPRFDGKFFVGVKTTGIYCRPICPAKPKRENVEFFPNHLAAEKAGYRPCLRCRPESAPLSPAWIGKSAIVQRAVKILNQRDVIQFNEDEFADLFGVSARHLRRVFIEEIGKTPKQLSFENRLNLSRKLITETSLSITDIAFASGFNSIRRFNDAFKERFKRKPTELRRNKKANLEKLQVSLSYRPPFDYQGLLEVYQNHRIGQLEWLEDGKMFRIVHYNQKTGIISISNDELQSRLIVEIDFPSTDAIPFILSRVRNMFDLDSDPVLIANTLEIDRDLKKLLNRYAGIRIPSGWDPFETAVSAILGQFVSIEVGRYLVNQLVELLGSDSGIKREGHAIRLFPTAARIAHSKLDGIKTTQARKKTLAEFARLVDSNELSLSSTQDPDEFIKKLLSIKGIGPWTAQYMALKVLRHTDAFPETDLIIKRAIEKHSSMKLNEMSPWRGYVTSLLWREYAMTLKKRRKK